MLESLKKVIGLGPKVDYRQLVSGGAVIVDVRTRGEYETGHVKGAVNIPLDALGTSLSKLKKDRVVITCCASGMRSAAAKKILQSRGYAEVYNGGSWYSLENKIK